MKKIVLLGVVALMMVIITIYYGIYSYNHSGFEAPGFEKESKEGTPKEDIEGYDIFEMGKDINVALTGNAVLENKKIKVYLTSFDENNIYIKLRILKDNNIIAESGLLKPGEYLENIYVGDKLNKGDKITLKVMGYEKETFYSAGSLELNTEVF